jgi:hypothetical protein
MTSAAIGLQMTLLPPLRSWILRHGDNTQRNERSFAMYKDIMNDGSMGGWMDGWIRMPILLVVVVAGLVGWIFAKKKSEPTLCF